MPHQSSKTAAGVNLGSPPRQTTSAVKAATLMILLTVSFKHLRGAVLQPSTLKSLLILVSPLDKRLFVDSVVLQMKHCVVTQAAIVRYSITRRTPTFNHHQMSSPHPHPYKKHNTYKGLRVFLLRHGRVPPHTLPGGAAFKEPGGLGRKTVWRGRPSLWPRWWP